MRLGCFLVNFKSPLTVTAIYFMINIQKLIFEAYLETVPNASSNGIDDGTPLFGGKGVLDSL